MKYYAIIVAGGSGNRMQTEIPKQFLLLQGLPVLMHTISAFSKSRYNPQILVVLNQDQHQYWADLCKEHNFNILHNIIEGGTERYYSVKNALDVITEDGIVAIHDAVRPLISKELIDSCFEASFSAGNAVAAIRPTDSIRKAKGNTTEAADRNHFYLVQTPQTFNTALIKKAYKHPYENSFTDDASVAEYDGICINLIEGERNNIKITYPADLDFAEMILQKKSSRL
ncbi:2-C-methyl-D-erythritol 4-phosphate cytidylyltransferase [Pedobacter punctiformis]|uniref:2-C-methyl-D-erythritol 4-phosphate cytidylyltransferase n=1 Tax=Pedobacter punctiformis TaxID=3004097 RepID=A0ABT4L7N4_9SPHI|nr:2-C-methyl-D-erythritol 4-phosphate cytidylyltransferase [Pedobacter sp. HCMS5-2]MCZ4243937.1 2-C-methyl-D-erythritol 4-phosphate cytidylyltransferase [Pedobacter sp. HCMS5-2]